jgi:hypothetical protein
VEVLQQYTDVHGVEDESEVSESTEEVDGGEEGVGEESDYPDTPQFTPFPNRNTISRSPGSVTVSA